MNWRSLKIAVVGPLPPPAGGMAGQTLQLVELLRGEGAEVQIVQTNSPYRWSWVASVRGLRALPRLADYAMRLWQTAGKVQIFHVMANSGWSWHLFATPAVWIGRLRGVRVVVNYRGGEAKTFLEQSLRWVRPTLRAASVLAVPSRFLQQVFGGFGFDVQVVPNIIDLAQFRPSVEAWDVLGRAVIFVPRNLEPIYDNATALRAFALVVRTVTHAQLVVAGSGPEEQRLKSLASELGVSGRVLFTGGLTREQMVRHYSDASIMLNPSLVDNMPNSVLEAMATGVPVVSTDVGGVPFVVSHERSALLVPAGDERRMAAAVIRVLTEPGLAKRLSAAGLVEVQRYTWPRVREVLGSLYWSLLLPAPPYDHPA